MLQNLIKISSHLCVSVRSEVESLVLHLTIRLLSGGLARPILIERLAVDFILLLPISSLFLMAKVFFLIESVKHFRLRTTVFGARHRLSLFSHWRVHFLLIRRSCISLFLFCGAERL